MGTVPFWGRALGAVAVAACVSATGCQSQTDSRPRGDAVCFPLAARRWIATDDVSSHGDRGAHPAPVVAYVDHSGSMAGFIRAETGDEQPLRDLIATLPDAAGIDDAALKRRLFGKTIQELPASRANDLLKYDTYACPSHAPACDNQESHLDLALGAIAGAGARELSFIVTDLWLDNSDLMTSGAVALSAPLQKILASGRSVAIYGMPAPYTGRVYDLPSGKAFSIASKRPLFLLAIGPVDRLERFNDRLKRSPSKFIADGIAKGRIKHSIFTLTPEAAAAVPSAPFGVLAPNRAIRPGAVMAAKRAVHIQQFIVDRRGLNDSSRPATQAESNVNPSWTGPNDSALLSGAVWKGPTRTRTTVWKLDRDRQDCSAVDWREWGIYNGGWSDRSPGYGVFDLNPKEVVDNLRDPGVYLITGEVIRTSLLIPNPGDGWMRDWSFSSEDESHILASPPAVFPTLNLSEMARLMENVLASAAERSPSVVGGFSVAVKIG